MAESVPMCFRAVFLTRPANCYPFPRYQLRFWPTAKPSDNRLIDSAVSTSPLCRKTRMSGRFLSVLSVHDCSS